MINLYLNQSLTHKTKTGVNKYNESTYTESTVKARFEYKRKMIRSKTNQDVISEARLFTTTEINVDDIIVFDNKDWIIISVQVCYDLDGSISHYEVLL